MNYTIGPKLRLRLVGAFTLVELLVVIVVIALLASIMAPFANVAAERARQNTCRSKMRNLYDGAAMYGGENRNLVPLIHEATDFGGIGRILSSGGRFADKYLRQSWKTSGGGYAVMMKEDNVFQCPSSLTNFEHFGKTESTNYRLSGFGLDTGTGSGDALHPNMMVIGGSVQKRAEPSRSGTKTHPSGEVAMAIDWVWSRTGEGLSGYKAGASLQNHRQGANVLYGSGATKWIGYESMLKVPTVTGFLRPPGTYGFVKGGSSGTHIFAPCGEVIKTSGKKDRKPGVGVMW